MPRKLSPDLWLFGVVLALVFLGVVMVYSASAIIAADRFGDPFFFLKKQLFWAFLGGGLLWAALRLDYRRLERLVVPLLVVSIALLVLVLLPPFGQAINGTRRWFRIGPLSFQPVELAKFALVLYLASFLTRRAAALRSFWQGLFPILLVAGTMALLTFVQPDLGNSLALVVLTLVLAYLAGAPVKHMAWVAAAALPLVTLAVALKPYRWRRMLAFVNPWDDPQGLARPGSLRELSRARAHRDAGHPDPREPRRGDGRPAYQGAAAALRLLRRLRAPHDHVLGGRAAEHLPARHRRRGVGGVPRPCLSATSRSTSWASAAWA